MLRVILLLLAGALLAHPVVAHAQTLEAIRAAHHMECGVVAGSDDWNGEDIHGNLSALETEVCRAVAVAILGDASQLDNPGLSGRARGVERAEIGLDPACDWYFAFSVNSCAIRRWLRASGFLQFHTADGLEA